MISKHGLTTILHACVNWRFIAGIFLLETIATYDYLIQAATKLASILCPADIFAVSGDSCSDYPVLQFAQHMRCNVMIGSWIPGELTNEIEMRPGADRVLLVTDPKCRAVAEALHYNMHIIAICNSDSDIEHVNTSIPGNNRSHRSVALLLWMILREVLQIRGEISSAQSWNVRVSSFMNISLGQLPAVPNNDSHIREDESLIVQSQLTALSQGIGDREEANSECRDGVENE